MGFNMRLLILTVSLIFVQLSQQAAVPNDVSELAFPDGEVEEPAVREEDVEYGFPFYLCKCSFEEYEDYWGWPPMTRANTTMPGVLVSSTTSTRGMSTPMRRSGLARRRPGVWTGRRRRARSIIAAN